MQRQPQLYDACLRSLKKQTANITFHFILLRKQRKHDNSNNNGTARHKDAFTATLKLQWPISDDYNAKQTSPAQTNKNSQIHVRSLLLLLFCYY